MRHNYQTYFTKSNRKWPGYRMKNLVQKIERGLNWQWLPEISRYATDQAMAVQQIAAPTFHEQTRADYVQKLFSEFELDQVSMDSYFNVFGLLPGNRPDLPAIMVSAHTDTVFPAEADLTLRQENDIIYGPGLGDNSFGVSGLLALIKVICEQDLIPQRDIWFVATTREEGLGDLGGMRAAYKTLQDKVCCVINLEGLAFGHIYHAGIAVRRLHIVATAPGGHSWLHFGRPSATHAIVELGSRILAIKPPETPRTTYNIGLLEGGQGINVIATQAGLWLDMRSEDQKALRALEHEIRQQIDSLQTEELKFSIEIVGDRPSGQIPANHPLVQAAIETLTIVGMQGVLETGSTDGNVPLAAGCPTVTIGITRGGNAHRMDEYAETAPVALGMKQLILLTLVVANNPDTI